MKISESRNGNNNLKAEVEASSATNKKLAEQSSKQFESPKQDYIHMRVIRGQTTDSHSLVERVICLDPSKYAF